nr:TRAP transporter small permease subunit [Halomonas socia]
MVLIDRIRLCLEKLLEVFSIFLLIALTTIVLAAVVFRTLGASLVWYDEVASVGLAWLTFYGACLATLKRAHMGFPGIVASAPSALRSLLFIISEIIVIGFFVVIAYYGYRVLDILAWDRLVSLPSISLTVTQSVIPISAVLFIVCECLTLPEAWKKMRAGVDSEHEAIEEAIRLAEEDLKENRS